MLVATSASCHPGRRREQGRRVVVPYRAFTSRTPGQDATVLRYDGKPVCELTVTDRRTDRPLKGAVVTDQRGRPLPMGDFC